MASRSRAGDARVALRTDDELVADATAGREAAFEELYRRHSQAAWGVAMSVTRRPDDAADAVSEAFTRVFQLLPSGRLAGGVPFRPYVLTATRNAAIDILRRTGRVDVRDDLERDEPALTPAPAETVVSGEEAQFVSLAFWDLPERWRSVLWLTEVEGIPVREAGPMLGLSANGAAQLAVRARNGLRERFLQAHLRHEVPEGCRFTVERLGAYVGGGLGARDLAKVDQHLAGCEQCRQRCDELEEVGGTLRRVLIPIPFGLGAVALTSWQAAGTHVAGSLSIGGAVAGGRGAAGAGRGRSRAERLARTQKALAGASAAILATGLVTATIRAGDDGPTSPGSRGRNEAQGFTVTPPVAAASSTAQPVAPLGEIATGGPLGDGGTGRGGSTGPVDPADGSRAPGAPSGGAPTSPTRPAPPAPAEQPLVQATGTLAEGTSVALGVGDASCTGAAAGGTALAGDCEEGEAPSIEVGGELLPGIRIP